MALQKRGNHWYGSNNKDIRGEIIRYAELNGYAAEHFADAVCHCSCRHFCLLRDDDAGVAIRRCGGCNTEHPIGDSDEYLDEAKLAACSCPCGHELFEISVGVALYDDRQAVRWLYLGCRCAQCGLIAVCGDWKNECEDYQSLLANV